MSMRLDDPRLAQLITELVDRRTDARLAAFHTIRYGVVTAVDAATQRASVRLGAAPDASPGFIYPRYVTPRVGDLVRAVLRGADRYIDANLSAPAPVGAPGWRWIGLDTEALPVPIDSTWTSGATITRPEVTDLPAGVVRAVTGVLYCQHSAANTTTAYVRIDHWDVSALGGMVLPRSHAGGVQYGTFMARTGGANLRQVRIERSNGGAGTLTYGVRITGYWTDQPLLQALLPHAEQPLP